MRNIYIALITIALVSLTMTSVVFADTAKPTTDTPSTAKSALPKFIIRSDCMKYFNTQTQGCRSECRKIADEKHYKRDTRSLVSIAATAQLGTCVKACNDWYTRATTNFCAKYPIKAPNTPDQA